MNNAVAAGRPAQDGQQTLMEDLGDVTSRLVHLAERLENFPRRIGVVPDSPEVPGKESITPGNLIGHISRLRRTADCIEYNLVQIDKIA